MRTRQEVERVLALHAAGLNGCEIARRTAIPRGTVKGWLTGHAPDFDRPIRPRGRGGTCPVCRGEPVALPQTAYTYLLGLYLGDGCLSAHPRSVYRLRITCANAYPELMRRCELAMTEVLPNKVGRVVRQGCTDVYSFSKHWICLFPQHGPGRKHERVAQIFSIISEINQLGTAILLVEQSAAMALQRAHRAYVLETGSIVRSDEAGRLLDDDSVRAAYLGGAVSG